LHKRKIFFYHLRVTGFIICLKTRSVTRNQRATFDLSFLFAPADFPSRDFTVSHPFRSGGPPFGLSRQDGRAAYSFLKTLAQQLIGMIGQINRYRLNPNLCCG
jgi:hypothetical protein